MRHAAFLSLVVAAALAGPVEALAQSGNSHSLGRQVAIELCSSCHRVTEGTAPPRSGRRELFCHRQLAVDHRPFPEGVSSVKSQGNAEPDRL